MEDHLLDFYQNKWENRADWLIDHHVEASIRKVETCIRGMPGMLNLDIKSVADYGCGYGKVMHLFCEKMKLHKAYGFDVSEKAINYAKQNYAYPGLEFHQLESLDSAKHARDIASIAGGKVDAVLLFDILEHVPDCITLMRNLSQVVSKYYIIMLPIEENIINNYFVRKIYPSSEQYNGHLREFTVNSVHYFIRKLGLTPVSEGFQIYDILDSYPPDPPGPITPRGIARKVLKVLRIILAEVLPKKIYLRLVGTGTYFCVATFNKEHILTP